MNKIDVLIAYLFAIQAFAKDIHYSVKGEAFYSKHLLADEIYKGIDEQIDALIETCILPYEKPKAITEYWELAREEAGIKADNFERVKYIIEKTLKLIEMITGCTSGERSLLDGIAQDLQRKLGLITRQVE